MKIYHKIQITFSQNFDSFNIKENRKNGYCIMWLYSPVYCTLQGIICPRTHDIYCSEAKPRTIFMCPRTNKPLYCTVDWEIKLLAHINPAFLLVQSLMSLSRGEIMPQISHYPPVTTTTAVVVVCWTNRNTHYRTIQGYISQLQTNRNRGFPLDVY